MKKFLSLGLALFALLYANAQVHNLSKTYQWPKDPLVVQKLKTWQAKKFGLLMHWGTYSEWGIVESWSICPEDEGWCERKGPYKDNYCDYVKAYENLQTTFNPVDFNRTNGPRQQKTQVCNTSSLPPSTMTVSICLTQNIRTIR